MESMTTQEIREMRISLEKDLNEILSRMVFSMDIPALRERIAELQEMCPHMEEGQDYNEIEEVCPICGKKLTHKE